MDNVYPWYFTAMSCNAKGFAIYHSSFFSFLLFLLAAFFGRTGNSFLSNFCQLFFSTCMNKIGSHSLETPVNHCVYVLKVRACQYGMPYDLEINSNGGLKGEHMKSCLWTTNNIISLLPQCLWPPCLEG